MQGSVPVLTRPFVQSANHVIEIDSVPVNIEYHGLSLVLLYGLDNGNDILRQWFEPTLTLSFKFRGLGTDREFELAIIGGRVLPRFQDGSIVDAGIKSGPKLIENLSELERELERDGAHPDGSEFAIPLPIHLGSDFVEVFLGDAVPSLGEFTSFETRPLDTGVRCLK
jgi:hypothetical protein